jgi:hypothetical protein
MQKELDVQRRGIHPDDKAERFLPRRIVDLGVGSASRPRLAESPGRDSVDRYATLSYCWGPSSEARQQLKLTCENREQFLKDIPVERMSPVLHDTIRVCRALKIQYIWIDALCILQGDKTDWEEQSSQMDKIFQHSYVTICAASSSSCMEGFLQRPRDSCRPSIQIPYVDETSNEVCGAYSLRLTSKRENWPASKIHPLVYSMLSAQERDLELSAWAYRGWVFQERFVSSMQIIFGATMLHIERAGIVISENGQTIRRDPLSSRRLSSSGLPTFESISIGGRHLPDHWYRIVEAYAGMSWTEKLDLFPGLSGIAACFERAMQDTYVAGLWQHDLHCGLLWRTGTSKSRDISNLDELVTFLEEDGLQISPSWSWASRPNYVLFTISPRQNSLCFARSHLRREFTLLESSIAIDGINPLGRIQKASLKISGFLVRLKAGYLPVTQDHGSTWEYTTSDGHIVTFDTDWKDWKNREFGAERVKMMNFDKLQLLIVSSCCSDWSGTSPKYTAPNPSTEKANDTEWITYKPQYRSSFLDSALGTAATCSRCLDTGRRRDIWGLLIYPTGLGMTFYRVGTFLCRAERGGSDLLQEAEEKVIELC